MATPLVSLDFNKHTRPRGIQVFVVIPILGGISGLPDGIIGLKDPFDMIRYVLFCSVMFHFVSFRICSDMVCLNFYKLCVVVWYFVLCVVYVLL